MRVVGIGIALVVGVIACSDPTVGQNGVTAALESQGVVVTNQTDRPLAVFALDADILALANWAACRERTPECLRLPAHGSIHIPFEQIGSKAKNIAVIVWDVVLRSDGTYVTQDVAGISLHR